MSCERDEALNALVDGQLRAEAGAELEAHLAECEGCRGRREALESLRRDLETAFAPEGRFAAALADRVATGYERKASSRAWLPWALAAAAALPLAFLLRPSPSPAPADAREKDAWEALERVHAWGRQYPQDPKGFGLRCEELARAWPETDAAAAAKRASASALHVCAAPGEDAELRRREALDAELASLDVELNAPLSKERYAEARRVLEAAAGRRTEPRWKEEVERRRGLLEARLAAQAAACFSAAKADPAGARVQRERVAAWGVDELLARFDVEVKLEDPKPLPAAEKGLLTLAVRGGLMVKGPEPRKGERVAPPFFVATREDALCAFETEGGDVLRVNAATRLMIERGGELALHEGEVFVVAKGAVALACGPARIAGNGATFEVSRRAGLRVLVLRGQVTVDGRTVGAGEMCKAVDGAFEPVGPAEDLVLATRWIHPLLRERPEDAEELRVRASGLAMLLDDPRLGQDAERELRALGSTGAAALLRLLQHGKLGSAHLKRMAALAADLAGPELVPEMIRRLGGSGPEVRTELARGLRRLTGQALAPTPAAWEAWRDAAK